MQIRTRYYHQLLAAFVRGRLKQEFPKNPLFLKNLEELSESEEVELYELGIQKALSLHKFKIKEGLPRVQKVLGLMQGLHHGSQLDIGSGRGAFLWPMLSQFPWLEVESFDVLSHRVRDLQAIAEGGYPNLKASLLDITESGLPDGAFDVVSILEVLEHIPNCEQALAEVCRLAAKAVLLSVPSKEDDNPEHIHLFTKPRLEQMFKANHFTRLRFHSVPNHHIVLALK